MEDLFKDTNQPEKRDINPKHHKDQEINHHNNSFTRTNST
jgi:hypothetical protein